MVKENRIRIFLFIAIILFLLLSVIVPTIIIKIKISKEIKKTKYNWYFNNFNKSIYFIKDIKRLSAIEEESNNFVVEFDESNISYSSDYYIKIIANDTINKETDYIYINEKKYNILNGENQFEIKLNEGKNEISILIYKENKKIKQYAKEVYYIKPYEKQFLDEKNQIGISTHFDYKIDNDQILDMLKNMGVKIIRDDISWNKVEKNGQYDFSWYDQWVNKLHENGFEIIAIINNQGSLLGNDNKLSSNNEVRKLTNFFVEFAKRYPFVTQYEILNEVNLSYHTKEDLYYYSMAISEIENKSKEINPKIRILAGSTGQIELDEEKRASSTTLIKNILELNYSNFNNEISIHQYDDTKEGNWFKQRLIIHNNLLQQFGGFTKISLTETGASSYSDVLTEKQQNNRILKYLLNAEKNNYSIKIVYNSKNINNDSNNKEGNYGIINYDLTPKLSYYGLKNYFENIKGSEYIGSLDYNIKGLETFVFNKNGHPLIIMLSEYPDKDISMKFEKDAIINDTFGKKIENNDGNLIITDSPIYIDNVSPAYFYQAISNSITNGYSEFKSKFADEISKVDGLTTKINDLNTQAASLKNVDTFDENKANELMKEHFELGNIIMSAYENGKLNIEYVKLSSMLDYLNTIGNSYEDLVTVSAKTRITDLSDITNEVNTAKSLAQDNEKFDIVYPNKIYKFAQDLLDTSSYVLGLEEENDIKTGLINSKALHARYLAEWSQEFSKIYMKDALKTSTNSFIEKNETIKNNNKVIYENPNVKRSYDKLKNSINTLIENPETNNVDVVYLNQINIAKTIMNEVIAKTINIQRDDYKKTICNILNISDDYRSLYNYYIKSDGIDRTQIKNNINKIINRYNDNLDISILSSETEMIKQVKDLYDNLIETDKISDNYLNKQRILQTCDIISQMLENDIKQHADKEFTQITKSSNHDLNKYTNQDEIITINLPNDKAKIADNNGENSITFSKNDSKTIKINIRGYEYDYKIEVTNIDKSYPTLNVSKEGTAITPKATDNNLDKITISKDGEEIKYNIDSTITEPGIYNITAIDKAGNKVNTKSIVYGTFINEQNVEEKYVLVLPGQKTQSIIENSEYSIANDKQQKSGNDLVATGDKLNSQNDTYIVITKGDITGSGKADIMSLVQLRKNIVGLKNFTKIQQLASDINSDGITSSIDLVSERKLIVGKE